MHPYVSIFLSRLFEVRRLWCNGYRCREWTWRSEFQEKELDKTFCIEPRGNTLGKNMHPTILLSAMGK